MKGRGAVAGLLLGLIAALSIVAAGLGTRWGFWHFRTGFAVLRYAAYGGAVAIAVSLAGGVMAWRGSLRGGLVAATAGVLLGATAFGVPWSWARYARHVPAIHDITTDTEDPPRFAAVLSLRKDAPNSTEYGGPELAQKQHAAYPDLRSLMLEVPPGPAFERSVAAARRLGWKLVDANAGEGRIEATDTTFWFGFKDDVVVRIAAAGQGSRVDVRSVSRVGVSDVGTNARRIRKFLKELSRPG
ncbi:MAG: DUF1499 domain-containing protein [Deltaproteobacteria bacterium]|nr:DUF1499 domain-containing protein [Deltaproteobacteria bacterium]